jgi:putative flippase GtrA
MVTRPTGGGLVPPGQTPVLHGLRFLLCGAVAFAVDAAVLAALTLGFGVHPILARLAAISLAMVAGWLMHRTFTFAVSAPPSLAEFLRFASVAWTAAALNYGVFVAILLIYAQLPPLAAMFLSSLAALTFTYLGLRFAAFRARVPAARE